jgi:hypothetical protein
MGNQTGGNWAICRKVFSDVESIQNRGKAITIARAIRAA